MQDGVIKYKQHFTITSPLPDLSRQIREAEILELNTCRKILFDKKWIGVYPDGIGYGNLSMRIGDTSQFIITASQTGHLSTLSAEYYTKVLKADISTNEVWCEGIHPASSEALTHAAIYELSPEIKVVIHIHSEQLWTRHLNMLPTTNTSVEYGTPEMAYEIRKMDEKAMFSKQKTFLTSGHKDGIFSFGKSWEEAMENLMFLEQ